MATEASGAGSGGGAAGAGAVRGSVAVALGLGQQRGQRARQRVDLVGGEHGAVGQVRLLLGEQPLEPEQQREPPAPLDRGLVRAGVDLGHGGVERAPAGRAGRQRILEGLALVDELLAREQLRPRDRGRFRKGGGITHTDRKVAFRECEPRRYCVATQAGSLETVRGRNYPQKRMPPRRTRLGGMAYLIKQVRQVHAALTRVRPRRTAHVAGQSLRSSVRPRCRTRELPLGLGVQPRGHGLPRRVLRRAVCTDGSASGRHRPPRGTAELARPPNLWSR